MQAGRANAARLVVLDTALGSAAARLGGGCAWIDAVFLLACLVKRTVVVNTTFRSITLPIRITAITFRARTHGVVSACCARCFARTRILHNARVDTALVDARLALWTFRVLATFGSWLNWIAVSKWISSRSLWTGTGCPVLADLTLRASSTRVGRNTRINTAALPTNLLAAAVVVTSAARVRRWR